MKQSKDQQKGENWEAHDFSVHLRVVIILAGDICIAAPLTLGKKKKLKKNGLICVKNSGTAIREN